MSLVINSVSKSFGEKLIFNNLSYEFKEHGIYALIGDSGVGKTTLLRMIAGLDTDFSGDIIGGGFKNVSFAFQEYRLFPELSALDNVIFANYDKKSEAVIKEAAEKLLRLGIKEADMNLLPIELSGGMKQRVSLARAFLRKSPILLLDEPTKELDAQNATDVIEEIKRQGESRLVIMVSHSEDDINELNAVKITIK